MAPILLYLRGLNTYGDDDFHLPPLHFGLMWAVLKKELPGLVPVPQMGVVGPEGMAECAARFVLDQKKFEGRDLVILGHSTGGLAARVLAHHDILGPRIKRVVTVGSPHLGSGLADAVLASSKLDHALAALVGYRLSDRAQVLKSLSTPEVQKLNQRFPDRKGLDYFSLAGGLPYEKLSWLGQGGARRSQLRQVLSDGFFSVESQSWGRLEAVVGLEHQEEIGYCVRLDPRGRKNFRTEFSYYVQHLRRLCILD